MNKVANLIHSDIGQLPFDWSVKKIDEITNKVGSGKTPRGGNENYCDCGVPFVRSQNVGWGILILDDLIYISPELHKTFNSTEISLNDILLNITGASIGRAALANNLVAGGNVNQHVCIIRTNANRYHPSLLKFALLSQIGQRQIDNFQTGGNREGLNFSQVRSIQLPVPPTLAEQDAIANVLSDADAYIESLEKLIEKKRLIKKGAMQELLTGKRRLVSFSKSWIETTLSDYATLFKGKGLPKSAISESGKNPCIHYGELFTRYRETIKTIKSGTDWSESRVFSQVNDVLMPTSDVTPKGLAKASCITQANVILGGDILIIRPSKNLSGSFLSYLIRFLESQILQLVTGTTVFHIYASDMKKFRFMMPEVSEQVAIVKILDDFEEQLTSYEKKLTKARLIKQGMMQQLLTGRIRL